MKLNMGCGHNKLPGFVNVDVSPGCQPDVVFDLETTPWPWESSSITEVMFNHSLEHLGADAKVFLAIMTELYRVCENQAIITIHVPHPRHDNFLGDPTHVRVITPQLLTLFDKALNDQWQAAGAANTPFAHYLGVDFNMVEALTTLDEPYRSQFFSGKLGNDELITLLKERNNIASEYQIKLRVRKLS